MPKPNFQIYIPEEGHWPIPGNPQTYEQAKASYLKWAGRKNLPHGSKIQDMNKPPDPPVALRWALKHILRLPGYIEGKFPGDIAYSKIPLSDIAKILPIDRGNPQHKEYFQYLEDEHPHWVALDRDLVLVILKTDLEKADDPGDEEEERGQLFDATTVSITIKPIPPIKITL